MQRLHIIDCDLFARFDVAQGKKQNMVVQDLHERVGTARVINVVRAVSAAAAIKTPAIIYLADPQHGAMRSPTRFSVGDFLPRVLSDLVSLFKGKGGEAAFTVNRRRSDCQTVREFHFVQRGAI